METRVLGNTGLQVSALGIGLAEIGELSLAEEDRASKILNTALDRGINFLDTAACYGNSEELVGRAVAQRRDEFVLATKAGHVAGGYEGEAWTAQTVRDSIDRSLQRLRTDHLDIIQLHSCGVEVLERGEVIEVLQAARDAGKTRFIGYSGDNESALWAVESGLFDTLQTSFNLVDQNARRHLFGPAQRQGMGIIAKRPIANAVWGAEKAKSSYSAPYFERAEQMASLGPISGAPDHGVRLALGFCLAHDAVSTAIVGTSDLEHLRQNIEWVTEQQLVPASVVEELHRRFEEFADGEDWRQRG
jgi:aryl-alcohol dehydrogenase-like predicted oxidoreductase